MILGLMAVASFVVGVSIQRAASSIGGDVAAGFGQLFIGLAAVIAALAGLRNGSRIKEAKATAAVAAGKAEVAAGHAEEAASSSAAAVRTLGPENGRTLRELLNQQNEVLDQQNELLHRVVGFEEYQHGRNHDLLSGISRLDVAMPVLVTVLERLIVKLDEFEAERKAGAAPSQPPPVAPGQ